MLDGSNDLTSEISSLIASHANGTHDLGSIQLGSFLSSPDVSVTLSNVAQQPDDGWTGTVTVDAASATLTVGSVTGSITKAGQDTYGLSGSYTLNDQSLGDGSYAFTASQVSVTVPGTLTAEADEVAVNYDPSGGTGQTIFTLNSATATLIPLNNATLTLSDLAVKDDGFTLGDATLTGGTITLGSVATITDPSIEFSDVSYENSEFTGTITASGSAALFPGNTELTASLANFKGTYDLASGDLTLGADSGEVAVGKIFDAQSTGIGLTWDGTNATVDLKSASLTSPLFPGASATLADFHGDNTGFTVGQADLISPEIKLGGVLDIDSIDLGITKLAYKTSDDALSADSISIGAGTVSILPGSSLFSSTVTGFNATYNLSSDAVTVKATQATIDVGSATDPSLVVTANTLGFSLTPQSGGDDKVFVTIGTASASLPQEDVSGSITGLAITGDGFSVASATLTGPASSTAFGGKFTIKSPSVTLTNFGYSVSKGAEFNSDLTLSTSEIDFNPTSTVSIAATDLSATISFTTSNVGQFKFTAGTVTADLGSYLTFTGSKITFDASATDGYIAEFGSLSAEVKVGGLDVTGSAQDFAIDASGNFVTETGYGVSLNLTNTGEVSWPSWLPIQVTTFDIAWPNFSTDPTDFTLVLSASIDAKLGSSGIAIQGSVTDVTIDTGLLEVGKFPITGLTGAGLGISGTLFGSTVSGSAFFQIADIAANGTVTDDPSQVASRVFYGGIEGSISFEGSAGFGIRLGVSSLGPLDAYLDVGLPILLDPESGLSVTNLYGEIAFDTSLPSITDPKQLATNPAFTPPTSQSLTDWEGQLAAAVATQAQAVAAGLSVLNEPIEIKAGATFFDEYATTNAFQLTGNVAIDTTGKFEASGMITLGDSVSLNGALYVDLSQAEQGKASLLLYAQAPAQAPLATLYGSVIVQAGSDFNLDGSTVSASASNLSLGTGAFSVEFYSMRADNNQAESVVSEGVTGVSGQGFQMGYNSSNHFVVTFGGSTLTSPSAVDGNWHQWAVTFDGQARTLYEDGVAVAHDTPHAISFGSNSSTFLVGQSGTTYFHGSVDAIRVWSLARSSSQILANYNVVNIGTPAGLVAYWTFYAGPETVAPDHSGQGHPLLISGTPTWNTPVGAPASPFAQDGFEITIGGEVDLSVPSLPGGLDIVGTAVFQADIAQKGLDLTVSGSASIAPLGQIAELAGNVHFDDTGGTPKLYGAVIVGGNLDSIPEIATIGLTASATGFLRFNTTGVAQTSILQLPAAPGSTTLSTPTAYSLPADSFSLFIQGSIGLDNVFSVNGSIYAAFSYAKLPNGSTDPELDLALLGCTITIGPDAGPDITAMASGVLIINSSGLATSLTVKIGTSLPGITLGATLSMTLNTTGKDESFTIPPILDPSKTDGSYLAGTAPVNGVDVTYTVPGAPTIGDTIGTAGTYLLLVGSGDLTVEKFDLSGNFDILVSPSVFRLDVNSMSLSVSGISGFSLVAQGGLVISSAGIAGALSLTLPASSGLTGSDFEIDGSFLFEVNTTDQQVTIGGISVGQESAELKITGDIKVGPSSSDFDVSGSLTILVNTSGLTLDIYGSADLGSLGSLSVGTPTDPSFLTITSGGVKGDLELSGSLTPIAGTSLTISTAELQFDTTTSVPTLNLSIDGDLIIGGGAFDLSGDFNLSLSPAGFSIAANNVDVSVLKAPLVSGTFEASFYKDTDGSTQFALYAGFTLGAGESLGGLNFSITASPSLWINTGSTAEPMGIDRAITPHSAEFDLQNAQIQAFGFSASGSLIAQISNGGFDIEIPESDPITLSFLSLGSMQVYGDFNSDGTFSITGSIHYDVTAGPFELYGGIGATISNTGFTAWFYGGANLNCGSLGTVNLASVSALISLMTDHIEIAASVHVLGLGFSFDESLGGFTPPAHDPGLNFYNVPTTAAAGTDPTFTALAYDPTNTQVPDGNYDWEVTGPVDIRTGLPYSASSTLASPSFTLGGVGTYMVSLYENDKYGHTLLKQSNINVFKQAPVVGSLNLQGAYLAGDPYNGDAPNPINIDPSYTVANPAIDTVTYSVTKNGAPWNGIVTVNSNLDLTLTPDIPNPTATQPDHYTVTYTITDPYNGSATGTGSFSTIDVHNLTVNSLADDTVTGSGEVGDGQLFPADGEITLRRAIDIIDDNTLNNGQFSTIRFDPSLAGGTIYLDQEEFFDGTDGFSDLGINSSIVIDGSNAPGLTIANAPNPTGTTTNPSGDRRLFYVAPNTTLTLNNVNLEGGIAEGWGVSADGGAIYIDGGSQVNLNNVALIDNQAVALYHNGDNNAEGGAIYISPSATLLATNSTFAGNQAIGSPDGNAYGGAIDNANKLALYDCTIADNTAQGGPQPYTVGQGGGVYGAYAAGSTVDFSYTIFNTIISNNVGGSNLQDATSANNPDVNGQDNLITSMTADIPTGQTVLGSPFLYTSADPKLGLLAQRGGLWSFSLLSGSPAIGHGTSVSYRDVFTDIRGVSRTTNGATDIGSFEHQASYVVSNVNGSGANSLAEALNADDDGSPITFASNLTGINLVYTTTDITTKVVTTHNAGPLVIARNMLIEGPGAAILAISGDGTDRIFQVNPGVVATISGLTLTLGMTTDKAGAIDNQGTLTLTNDVLSNNTTGGGGTSSSTTGEGGAIYNDNGGTLKLVGDTFSGNLAQGNFNPSYTTYLGAGSGGAIYNVSGGTITGNDDTFSGNTASGGADPIGIKYTHGYGGAIWSAGTATLTNVTLANDAVLNGKGTVDYAPTYQSNGADIWVNGGTFTLNNSIAADATGGNNITNDGTFNGSSDLVMTSTGLPTTSGLVVSTADPKLQLLGNYGGPTPTFDLKPTSPAIGVANNTLLPTSDQRDDKLILGIAGDLGSVQLQYLIVTNDKDYALAQDVIAGSLREVIADDIDETPITFSANLSGHPIVLTGGPLTLTRDTTITGLGANSLTINANGGQAFLVNSVTASISGLSIINGLAALGGAIDNTGTLTLTNDAFSHNSAIGTNDTTLNGLGAGGAIFNAPGAILTVTGSTFLDNSALGEAGVGGDQGRGGAIDNEATARLTLIDDTFSGNAATGGASQTLKGGPAHGGGLANIGTAVITNVTFDQESALGGAGSSTGGADGADISNLNSGTLILYNSIAANPQGASDLYNQGTASGSANIVMSSSGLNAGIVASTADPDLAPLANNGGTTQTYALNKLSDAIGAGVTSVAPALDQRGDARIVGGAVDIGAYETQVIPVSISNFGADLDHVGQTATLSATVANPSNSTLTYTWTISGPGLSNQTYTTSAAALNLATANLAPGTYQVGLQASDGYGNNHNVTASTTLTLLPVLQVTTLAPSNPAPAINTPFDTADITLNVPATVSTLGIFSIALTLNGGADLIGDVLAPFPKIGIAPNITVALVAGTTSTYRVSGLAALMAAAGPGQYTLTVNAVNVEDTVAFAGTGSVSATWVYDTTAPTSQVSPLPVTETSTSFAVTATGTDPGSHASGVASYALYVSTDGGAFAYWTSLPASSPTATFTGQGGHSYGFQSFATDAAGNIEMKRAAVEAGTYVANTSNPSVHVTYVDSSQQKFTVAFSGTAANGNVLDHVDVYVVVDGGTPELIGKVASASGSVSYEAIADGRAHIYGFYSIGVDKAGNVQPTPYGPGYDVDLSATFGAPAANVPIGLTVDHGAPGRSFVRYVDLVFDNSTNLAGLIRNNEIHLTQYALDGTGGTPVSLAGVLHVVDHAIEFDFGTSGIGGSPTTTLGDGYYEIGIDGVAQAFHFDRILGDVNGDGVVDATDQALVTGALNSTVPGEIIDVDGTGKLTTSEALLVLRNKNHKLAAGLSLDA